MRVDVQQVFNVSIQLCEFFNVELEERGYYQIRLKPKKANEMMSVEIHLDNADDTSYTSPNEDKPILGAQLVNGSAISKTVEVTYRNEKLLLDDCFNVSVQYNPTLDLCESHQLELDIELWYMDRYRPPRLEFFEKMTKRTVQIPLDPTRLISAARSLYFDCCYLSAITFCVYSSLIQALTKRKKTTPEANQQVSTKLRRIYNSSAHSMLFTTLSIQQFCRRYERLTNSSISMEMVDVQNETRDALRKLESSETPWVLLENDLSEWSARLTLILQQMILLYRNSKEVRQQLLLQYDKQRKAVFREAFFFSEKSMSEIGNKNVNNASDLFNIVVAGKYLKKLPRITIFCAETDSPGENCPIVFEECFTTSEERVSPSPSSDQIDNGVHPTATTSTSSGSSNKTKSFRERLRFETRKLIRPRRKSLDCSQSLLRNKLSDPTSRGRTKTTTGNGLLLKEIPLVVNNNDADVDSIGIKSLPDELGRCSAAGNSDNTDSNSPIFDNIVVSPNEIVNALRASVSADEVHNMSYIETGLPQDHPKDMIETLEFLREKEAVKRKLMTDASYDGFLYSELASKSGENPIFSPITSSFVARGNDTNWKERPIHLIVFAHGLEGSHDDLMPFRWAIQQSCESYYLSQNLNKTDSDIRWDFEYLMSKSNLTETWADITTMARNLLLEIREMKENFSNIDRVSFVAHSLGGVIVRSAIGLAAEYDMQWMVEKLHTLMTINSPHLGLSYVGKHVHWGIQFIKWWKRSRSMEQLSFRDDISFSKTFLYTLTANNSFGEFKNVLLIGCPHDQIVPHISALLETSKHSVKDESAFGSAYREMISNCLSSIKKSTKTENFVRYISFHQISTSNSNKLTGRAAHIAAAEDLTFIEKLFSMSAVKYFV